MRLVIVRTILSYYNTKRKPKNNITGELHIKATQTNTPNRNSKIDRERLTYHLNLLLDKLSLENLERIYRIVLIWLKQENGYDEHGNFKSQNVEE